MISILTGLIAVVISQSPTITSGFARLREPRLYYESAGSGEAVVLIHGGQLDRRMWSRCSRATIA